MREREKTGLAAKREASTETADAAGGAILDISPTDQKKKCRTMTGSSGSNRRSSPPSPRMSNQTGQNGEAT